MAARFLLDTNILSDVIHHPQGRIAERLIQEGEGSVCTSSIVASELRFVAAKCGSPRLTAQLEAVLAEERSATLNRPKQTLSLEPRGGSAWVPRCDRVICARTAA